MPEPTSWIDVVDTAVKVGLGALIGGGFSYILARLDYDREARRELAKRRLDKLEAAFEAINTFSSRMSAYWANLSNGVFKKSKGTLTPQDALDLQHQEQEVFEGYLILAQAKAHLELLGETPSIEALDRYRSAADQFFKIANIENEKCTSENLASHREHLVKAKKALARAINRAYTKS